MVNFSGLTALNVAIGLAALFFVLATALSAINEAIANVLGWRAKTLEDAIRTIIGDPAARHRVIDVVKDGVRQLRIRPGRRAPAERTPAEKPATSVAPVALKTETLYAHWRMRALVRDPASPLRRRSRPSYVPPRAFSLALAEVLAQHPNAPADGDADPTPWARTDAEVLAQIRKAHLPDGELNELVQRAAGQAFGSLEAFRVNVERVFDDTMERASGWYKRKVQAMLLVLAAVVVIGLNVDTVHVGTALWNDAALRTAVAAQASSPQFQGSPSDAANAIDRVAQLKVPMGWGPGAQHGVLAAIPGWIVTIAALSLGAPFWFDVLSRVARMRGSGVPERPRSLSDTAGAERARTDATDDGAPPGAVPPAGQVAT